MPPFQTRNSQPPIYADQQIEPPQAAQPSLLARLITPVIVVALYAAALGVIAVSLAG